MSKNITLKPEQIEELKAGIQESLSMLTDIDKIIYDTADDLGRAKRFQDRAKYAEYFSFHLDYCLLVLLKSILNVLIIFRERASEVLNEAVAVRDELSKTLDAQRSAETAIDNARVDIEAADIFLKQVKTLLVVY